MVDCTGSQVHLELALYHELGRFSSDQVPDLVSARFHLETAGACNLPSALYTLAHIYLQQPHDSFKDISVEVRTCMYTCTYMLGLDLMIISVIGRQIL